MVPTPRRSEDGDELGFEPEQLTINYAKRAEHVTSSRRLVAKTHLKLVSNGETLIHGVSEQAELARTVEVGQFYITNEYAVDEN